VVALEPAHERVDEVGDGVGEQEDGPGDARAVKEPAERGEEQQEAEEAEVGVTPELAQGLTHEPSVYGLTEKATREKPRRAAD